MTVDWGSQINYLKATRDLYYNDDYLAFFVRNVCAEYENNNRDC